MNSGFVSRDRMRLITQLPCYSVNMSTMKASEWSPLLNPSRIRSRPDALSSILNGFYRSKR